MRRGASGKEKRITVEPEEKNTTAEWKGGLSVWRDDNKLMQKGDEEEKEKRIDYRRESCEKRKRGTSRKGRRRNEKDLSQK